MTFETKLRSEVRRQADGLERDPARRRRLRRGPCRAGRIGGEAGRRQSPRGLGGGAHDRLGDAPPGELGGPGKHAMQHRSPLRHEPRHREGRLGPTAARRSAADRTGGAVDEQQDYRIERDTKQVREGLPKGAALIARGSMSA